MRTVHVANSPFEAHMVAHILRDAGFEVLIEGEHLQGALGDLPMDLSTKPSVVVVHDEDADGALSVLAERKRSFLRGDEAE